MTDLQAGILVVALPSGGSYVSAYELLTLGRTLADSLKEPLCAVVMGKDLGSAAQDLIERGADKVFVVEHDDLAKPNDELQSRAIVQVCEAEKSGKILFPGSVAGRSLGARVSVKLKAAMATDVFQVGAEGGALTVKRGCYGGNIIAEIGFNSPVVVLTLQGMVWPPAAKSADRQGEVKAVSFAPGACRTRFISAQAAEGEELDVGSADIVVSGGRGVGGADGFKPVRALARQLNAAVGASRAAVDSGWIPYRHQVGLTGRTIRPSVYFACGISGQIQHLAGMSSAKNIVAVNIDPDCPMMKAATLAVEGDLHEVLPLVSGELVKRKGAAAAA